MLQSFSELFRLTSIEIRLAYITQTQSLGHACALQYFKLY